MDKNVLHTWLSWSCAKTNISDNVLKSNWEEFCINIKGTMSQMLESTFKLPRLFALDTLHMFLTTWFRFYESELPCKRCKMGQIRGRTIVDLNPNPFLYNPVLDLNYNLSSCTRDSHINLKIILISSPNPK